MVTEIGRRNKRNRWRSYNFERRVAKLLGGVIVGRSKAIPVGGGYVQITHQHPPDVVTLRLSVECKYFAELPKGITEPLAQAVDNAPEGLMPVVFMGDRGQRNRVVILRESDFMKLETTRGDR